MNTLSIPGAKEILLALHAEHGPGVLAFDGDGTLWTGDVAEDVIHAMLHGRRLRDNVTPLLLEEAVKVGYQGAHDPHALLEYVLAQDHAGKVDHERTCELIGALLAGFSTQEFHTAAFAMLQEAKLRERLIGETWELLRFGRTLGHRILVVSASPLAVVDAACDLVGLEADRAGVVVHTRDEVYVGTVARPIPYGPGKVTAIRQRAPEALVHAAFGDNRFDIPMLQEAKLSVAIRPKEALRVRAHEVPGLRLLEAHP